jgi:HPt (histidine-containing phosphotransfer) domain-containing protein
VEERVTTTGTAPNDAPSLNLQHALSLTGGSTELLLELAEIFVREVPDQIAALRAAESSHDAKALTRTAHTVKGAARLFGARAVEQSAEQVEDLAKSDDFIRAAPHCRQLIAAICDLCTDLANFTQGDRR